MKINEKASDAGRESRDSVMALDSPTAWRWVLAFCVVDFANRVVFGAFNMISPAQPFLAENVGVDIETFASIYAFGECNSLLCIVSFMHESIRLWILFRDILIFGIASG